MIGRTAALGLGLSAAMAMVGWLAGARQGLIAALGFGLLATLLQTVAVALVVPTLGRSWDVMYRRWLLGMALRLLGVVSFAMIVWRDREQFPPLLAALGLLGVMVPLLFYEGRLLR